MRLPEPFHRRELRWNLNRKLDELRAMQHRVDEVMSDLLHHTRNGMSPEQRDQMKLLTADWDDTCRRITALEVELAALDRPLM